MSSETVDSQSQSGSSPSSPDISPTKPEGKWWSKHQNASMSNAIEHRNESNTGIAASHASTTSHNPTDKSTSTVATSLYVSKSLRMEWTNSWGWRFYFVSIGTIGTSHIKQVTVTSWEKQKCRPWRRQWAGIYLGISISTERSKSETDWKIKQKNLNHNSDNCLKDHKKGTKLDKTKKN